ncbi:MAG: pterin-4-alpha-carbinolamine dehydratase [uncultured bacterium]|nr:MAG: pterin-4-alpha-carbinolamine dehydratase [uncultured bacterium]OGT16760.1 MAG: 4a-hydroxytetrahydrobiopterin dehydratase [Gammaproteobacteria bacterium RIFCSPHIGHO2_02_FULL_38_33]OGT23604.1 MAG: 4a-hydroxytetrahydrobiopterin dehydratase [Gammaproteobacteria bacterium RIFCSPHIGHO2_12_38_15]OGT68136.1 MAG: 4a-hydroxytetrahydrobiopterin dehydratase [Gammaproteobacteria bacterium RIFCSPLOWO2_02_FULL_38_11]
MELTQKRCLPCEGGVAKLTATDVKKLLKNISEWQANEEYLQIYRDFKFRNYYQTIAFVNAVAWMAHQENHHPDLEVSYNHCLVRYNTHAIGGLSENDFICAAKVNALLEENK